MRISVRVNGRVLESDVESRTSLADHLRHGLGLTGTHVGCEHGVCGACTVLVDGVTSRSCLMLAVQADGADVTTVEGVANGPDLHPIQQALWQKHGLQCGFCTPGVVMSLVELLRDIPDPGEEQIRDVLSGHLCRCTGYQNIVAAALEAARVLRGEAVS
jgi:carbon-monoxide dehydrogenase small subunit